MAELNQARTVFFKEFTQQEPIPDEGIARAIELMKNGRRWNRRYRLLESELKNADHIFIPRRPPREQYVASSFQFTLTGFSYKNAERFLEECLSHGVQIK